MITLNYSAQRISTELIVVLMAGTGTTSPSKSPQQLLSGAARDHPSVIKVLI